MAFCGQVIDNPVTGERIIFRETAADTGGERLAFDLVLDPNGHVPAPHIHPMQEERFEVLRGKLTFCLNLKRIVATAGDTVVVPPGATHLFVNRASEPAYVRVEVRPALRMEQLLETAAALAQEGRTTRTGMPKPLDLALFMNQFEQEVKAPLLPARVMRNMMAPLEWLAVLTGHDKGEKRHNKKPRVNVRRLSALDLFGPRFVLLTGTDGASWIEAARQVAARLGLDIGAHRLGDDTLLNAQWLSSYGVSQSGAVLVCPDGVVNWRAAGAEKNPEHTLEQVLTRLLQVPSYRFAHLG